MNEYPGKLISNLYRKSQIFWGQFLKEHDITSAEYPILITLNQKDGITQEEIARRLSVDKSGVTRAMKSLLEKGFIERRRDAEDLRCNRICLTEKGHASWGPIQEGMKRWHEITSENIETEEMEVLVRVLSRMADNIEDYQKTSKEF